MPPNDTHIPAPTWVLDYHSVGARKTRQLAVETAVNLVYGSIPFAVMMATPSDLIDFAYGFSLTEGIVEAAADITAAEIEIVELGFRLSVSLRAEKMQNHLARKRALSGRTGCGLCGI